MNQTQVTIFNIKEVLTNMLSNSDIMNPKHILFFYQRNPSSCHPPNSEISEVISSHVFKCAHLRLCKSENDVLWLLGLYNDEINFDSRGKMILDPFSLTFLRLPLHIRHQPWAWRIFGIIHGIDSPKFHSDSNTDLSSNQKMQMYHKVLKVLFHDLEVLIKEGGIPWNLKLINGHTKKVKFIPYINFIICDTKGHDAHCGRMASHHIGMKQLLRDCDITTSEAENIDHVCCFRTKQHIQSLSSNDISQISFNFVDNSFWNLDFGDNLHGIYGSTPGETLHVFESGLVVYLTTSFLEGLGQKSLRKLQATVRKVVYSIEAQTHKKTFPCVTAFRNGIFGVKILTSKEKIAKVFVLYLSLLHSDCYDFISQHPKTSESSQNSSRLLKKWVDLMEETLCLSQWLKKIVHHPKDLFSESWLSKLSNRNRSNTNLFHNYTDDNDMVDDSSISQIKIKRYLNKYHDLIKNRGGNNLSIPKFHLILHFFRNICRLGSLPQYDGSTLESHAKYLSKSPGLRTNMHHNSISIQTAVRYHEDLTILECERLYHRNRNIQSNYSYFNKDPISSKKIVMIRIQV